MPESFSCSPVPPLLLLSSHFLIETLDGLVHLFPLLFTECSGRKMKFMVIGLCQAGQGALFPSGCSLLLSLFLSHSISTFLSLSIHFHLIPSVCSVLFLFHSVFILFTASEINFNSHGLLRLTGVSESLHEKIIIVISKLTSYFQPFFISKSRYKLN